LLGDDIIGKDCIDRSKVAKKVFQQMDLLDKLEALLHPAVREEIEKQYERVCALKSAPIFIAEIPLLYETGGESNFHYTIAVLAPQDVCMQRFEETTGYDNKEFIRRMERQMPSEEKARRADFVLYNNGSLVDLKNAVKTIYENLVNQA
jgi:dephospho-CoA kinase